ncbi:MAG: R3H domain-containing nucleic acid-binding protein [Oculatellaceae cyanobacterium bins.114]|nr:R3H domain-containing nucleic acid-binding protein [Oculatellaceae cyanobacterium bins.114]
MTFNGNTFFEKPENSDASADESNTAPIYITDDLNQLLDILPEEIRLRLNEHPQKNQLIEVVLDLGRRPEARFPQQAEYLSEMPVSSGDLRYCVDRIGHFSGDNRAGIEKTLHRISAIRNRMGEVIGLTCRVGRAVYGTIGMIRDLVETGKSILMLGRPGVGKTTALREIARVLADELDKRVVIIDTSNEIAGDGDIPHPAIGRARRMQVARPELQHQVMIEAVENHMPEVIVIDEIGTELEALAARTIAERGVQLVGTAHGNRIENLMKNPTLSDLVGGIQSVTLGDEEARRRGSQKSVLERKAPPTFDIAVEMLERHKWVVHENVSDTVDLLLRGRQPNPQLRTVDSAGHVSISHEAPTPPNRSFANSETRAASPLSQGSRNAHEPNRGGGWRMSGKISSLPSSAYTRNDLGGRLPDEPLSLAPYQPPERQNFDRLLNESFENPFSQDDLEPFADIPSTGPNGEDLPLHVYPYAVSRHMVDQIIRTMNLPIVLTKDVDSADTVLALRSHIKNHSKLRHMAKSRQLSIYTIKANNMPQIIRALQRMLHIDTRAQEEPVNLSLFSQSGEEDELEALEEARLAVEQIVIPKGQPVELLPRSAKVRKMQHELVEHYRLKSTSFGEEPNRRLRIYPA